MPTGNEMKNESRHDINLGMLHIIRWAFFSDLFRYRIFLHICGSFGKKVRI